MDNRHAIEIEKYAWTRFGLKWFLSGLAFAAAMLVAAIVWQTLNRPLPVVTVLHESRLDTMGGTDHWDVQVGTYIAPGIYSRAVGSNIEEISVGALFVNFYRVIDEEKFQQLDLYGKWVDIPKLPPDVRRWYMIGRLALEEYLQDTKIEVLDATPKGWHFFYTQKKFRTISLCEIRLIGLLE
ncbi:MAG: hypothetical protein A3J46_06365 [Candidatus Yanofskybacteria bacterium RIFCSPHIGHO2_02_FULL_41_11]|uniref:Uncharacterized protein n=1 Tax=Candidatus Yanofskybacteria bacterium RIFCSPHIGHO2_02_FULL_41_11 TaxID=1802675 RepID=A0A1F8FDW9_9BACT|nr:MAG: hypothetical protein A3J46_06365 [Candidatus Yanofskybacteria bacterium RIFCSPHIGHO2_02_FULL_41_11]